MEQPGTREADELRRELASLQQRIGVLERSGRFRPLPNTALLDESFLKRAFAVLGHYTVAGIIIAIPFYILMFLFVILTD
jgi:hypothetical protein